jgi:hypothetical protein
VKILTTNEIDDKGQLFDILQGFYRRRHRNHDDDDDDVIISSKHHHHPIYKCVSLQYAVRNCFHWDSYYNDDNDDVRDGLRLFFKFAEVRWFFVIFLIRV